MIAISPSGSISNSSSKQNVVSNQRKVPSKSIVDRKINSTEMASPTLPNEKDKGVPCGNLLQKSGSSAPSKAPEQQNSSIRRVKRLDGSNIEPPSKKVKAVFEAPSLKKQNNWQVVSTQVVGNVRSNERINQPPDSFNSAQVWFLVCGWMLNDMAKCF